MTGLIGAVYLRWSGRSAADWSAWLCEMVLAGFGCVLYRAGLWLIATRNLSAPVSEPVP